MRVVLITFICVIIFPFYCLSSNTTSASNIEIQQKSQESNGYGANDQRKLTDAKNGGLGGLGPSGCACAAGAGNLIHSLVVLVITVLAQLLNAVVTIVQCLLGVEGINSLVGNILTNGLSGVVGVLNNLVSIIGQTLGNLTG